MRPRIPAALAALALALGAAGCGSGGSSQQAPQPEPVGTGYYVGGQGGIGASLDLLGEDRVSQSIERALVGTGDPEGPPPEVGIASLVNDTPDGFPLPRFIAILESGRAVVLEPAAAALRGVHGAIARQALVRLRAQPPRVPPRGAAVVYVVLRDAQVDEVRSISTAAGPYPSITLAARRR